MRHSGARMFSASRALVPDAAQGVQEAPCAAEPGTRGRNQNGGDTELREADRCEGIDAVSWRVGMHPGEVKRKQAKSAIGPKRRLLWRSGMSEVVGRPDVIGTMPERRN
jgi:hypothetical protein